MSGEPKATMKWIPTSALPIDLLAQAARHATTETRQDKSARTLRVPPWVRGGIAFAAAWGVCAAAFSVDPRAFASVWRWLPLIVGAALVGLAIARRRAATLRPEQGQGLVIGPTSLVLVDARSVAVLPAERLAVSVDHIEFDGVVIDSAFHDPEWRRRLDAAVAAARGTDGARDRDRWRMAADAVSDAARATWASSNATTLAAVGIGVCVAIFLEAGPLDARARAATTSRLAAWTHASELETSTIASLGARLDASTAWTEEMRRRHQEEDRVTAEAAQKKRAAADRLAAQRRVGLLARLDTLQKSNPSINDVLDFKRTLPDDDEVMELRVLELLRARCRAQYPDNGGTQRQRVQRVLLRSLCADDSTLVSYDYGDGTDSDDARTVADALAADLQTISASLGRMISARARAVKGAATLQIDIVITGKPKPAADNPRRMDTDCTVTVQIVDDDLKDTVDLRKYVTNGVLGAERR